MHIKRIRLATTVKVKNRTVDYRCEAEIVFPDGRQYKKPYYFMKVSFANGKSIYTNDPTFVDSGEIAKHEIKIRTAKALGHTEEDVTFENPEWEVIEIF